MEKYKHTVQYYETDRMGVTHHSNYVRWMEEARTDFFIKIGFPYEKFEEEGLISPVVGIDCKFKKGTTFMDEVETEVSVKEYNGIILKLEYVMTCRGNTVFIGHSETCFTDTKGNLLRTGKAAPELHEVLLTLKASRG